MNYYSTQITNLIEELRRLPGIGSKSAQRLAFHIINMPEEHVHHLAQTLVTAREKIRYCKYCCTLTDSEVCPICASTKRDHSTIMVVEHTQDLAAYEKTGQYHGVYHVLHCFSLCSCCHNRNLLLFDFMKPLQGFLAMAVSSLWCAGFVNTFFQKNFPDIWKSLILCGFVGSKNLYLLSDSGSRKAGAAG